MKKRPLCQFSLLGLFMLSSAPGVVRIGAMEYLEPKDLDPQRKVKSATYFARLRGGDQKIIYPLLYGDVTYFDTPLSDIFRTLQSITNLGPRSAGPGLSFDNVSIYTWKDNREDKEKKEDRRRPQTSLISSWEWGDF